MSRVTVVIPTYNRPAWLSEAMQSVLAQTYTDVRLIVGDNASDDETGEVVNSFDDPRIQYSRAEHNAGYIANFNRLIELANSEYVLILADDDLIYPEYLEAALGLMDRFPTAGLVHSASDVIDADSKVTMCWKPLRSRAPLMLEGRDKALERLMISHWPLSFSSVMYRRSALLGAGGFLPEEEPFGDLHLWMRIALNWDFGYIPRPLGALRGHPGTLTSNVEAAWNANTATAIDPRLAPAGERFKRRTSFLEAASLAPETKEWLSALAALALLCEQADAGPPWPQLFARVARLATTTPRIITQRVFWLVLLRVEAWRLRLIRWRPQAKESPRPSAP